MTKTRIAILDVGHGVCLILAHGQKAIMIDCPPSQSVERWLRRNGVSTISHLIISHFDQDHCAGFQSLLNSGVRFEHLWFTDDQLNETRAYLHLSAVLSDAGRRGVKIQSSYPHSAAQGISWNETSVEWILPSRGRRMLGGNRNSLSVVCRILAPNGRGILCLSDVDLKGWRLRDPTLTVACDWVIAAHHGGGARTPKSAVTLMDEVLAATQASHVYFSMARNRYRLPIREVARGAALHARVACSQVSTHCLPGAGIGEPQASIVGLLPCAGTVELEIEPSGFRWVGADAHSTLVSAFESRLCRS